MTITIQIPKYNVDAVCYIDKYGDNFELERVLTKGGDDITQLMLDLNTIDIMEQEAQDNYSPSDFIGDAVNY